MFSRKRSREDNSWETFVSSLRTLIDKQYPQINTIKTAPLSVHLFMSVLSRIPLSLFEHLEYDGYSISGIVLAPKKTAKPNLCVQIAYTEKKVCLDSSKIILKNNNLQSPKQFLEQNLKLKNEDTVALVQKVVVSVHKMFNSQMNWNLPYNIIYFKKHNQIIIRFKFKENYVRIVSQNNFHLKSSWIEFSKKKGDFFMVSIIENCV